MSEVFLRQVVSFASARLMSIVVSRLAFFALAIGLPMAVVSNAVNAQETADKPKASSEKPLSVELNKLEKLDGGCRAYVVVTNKSAVSYRTMQLDLVLFRSDGIIGRRLALELAPIPKEKRRVKLFDLDGVSCDDVGTFLINDIMECRSDDGPADDCLSKMAVTSRTNAKLSK